ncbi:hypothetical protein BgiMline_032344 [Biomphalaria glabrata]
MVAKDAANKIPYHLSEQTVPNGEEVEGVTAIVTDQHWGKTQGGGSRSINQRQVSCSKQNANARQIYIDGKKKKKDIETPLSERSPGTQLKGTTPLMETKYRRQGSNDAADRAQGTRVSLSDELANRTQKFLPNIVSFMLTRTKRQKKKRNRRRKTRKKKIFKRKKHCYMLKDTGDRFGSMIRKK